jgi:flagellar basal body-associated protein FliL
MAGDSDNDGEFVSQDEIDRLLSQEDESPEDNAESVESMRTEDDSNESASPVGETPSDAEAPDDHIAGGPFEPESSGKDGLDEPLEGDTDSHERAADTPVDRVILEEVPTSPSTKAHRRNHIRTLRKNFWITLSVVCILGTGLNMFFWVHKQRSLRVVEAEVLSFPVVDTTTATAPVTFRDNPRAFTMKGFLVPAPMKRKDLTYITADVTVELTNSDAVSLIKAHAPFYRNIIYEVIKGTLRSVDKSKINEISLKIEILKALNGSVPERSVRDVSVDTFVMF